jgi:hypothetical protein
MTNEELDGLFGKIQFNTGWALPERLLHDLWSFSGMYPSRKNCTQFTRGDFQKMVEPMMKPKLKKKPRPRVKVMNTHRKNPPSSSVSTVVEDDNNESTRQPRKQKKKYPKKKVNKRHATRKTMR